MDDKILQTKKEIKQIIKMSGFSRLEKYNFAVKKLKKLNKTELNLLLKECYRDYQIYNRYKTAFDMLTIGLTGIGFIVTFSAAYSNNIALSFEQYSSLLYTLLHVLFAFIFLDVVLNIYRNHQMNTTQYIIDILEEHKH